jgi:hypothetical protein
MSNQIVAKDFFSFQGVGELVGDMIKRSKESPGSNDTQREK